MLDYAAIGRRSRNKGTRFERRVARLLSEYLGMRFQRTPCSGGSFIPGDIVRTDGPFHLEIECKDRGDVSIERVFRSPGAIRGLLHPKRLLVFNSGGDVWGVVARAHVTPTEEEGISIVGLITHGETEYLLFPLSKVGELHPLLFEKA